MSVSPQRSAPDAPSELHPIQAFLLLLFWAFISEVAIMLLLPLLGPLSQGVAVFLDPVLLVFTLILPIFFILYLPMRNRIVAQKQTKAALTLANIRLHEEENRLQAILNSTLGAVITLDAKGIIKDTNRGFDSLFGYPPGEMVGKGIDTIIALERLMGHSTFRQHPENILNQWVGSVIEAEGICRDASRFIVELTLGKYLSGDQWFFTGVLYDITARKQASKSLDEAYTELEQRVLERTWVLEEANQKLIQEVAIRREAEEKQRLYGKVFDNAGEGIVITDADARILAINPAYVEMTGFTGSEVIGANPKILRSGRHGASFYQEMWKSLGETGQWKGEIWNRKKTGEVFPKWLSINSVRDDAGRTSHYVGVFSDITHVQATEERMQHLAYFDPLTHLPNRMLFRDRVTQEVSMSQREGTQAAIFFIDLDRFKYVNDTMGHDAGDQLLVQVSERLQKRLRQTDTIARMGGDEFTVLLPNPGEGQNIGHLAEKVIMDLKNPFMVADQEFFIGASIGIAIFPDDGVDYETLTKNADIAMYHAKEAGRGTFKFFSPVMNEKTNRRLSMEMDLRKALEQNELVLYYQPKIDVSKGLIMGMEALVRWMHPEKGMISPGDFIPLAEETGLIVPMGLWVLVTACRQVRTWRSMGWKHLRVAVNLSARQVQGQDIVRQVADILADTGLGSDGLELEITESIAMSDITRTIGIITEFRQMGLHISIDDFGTGYSSLSYLKSLPLHALKIDQSFVRDLVENSEDASIVTSIISMAAAMNLEVVAEGVETEAQLAFLAKHHCSHAQGYFFSRPVSAEAFLELLQKQPKDE
ncbi:MAG: putative diguanylate kinase [Magnetococcales bacterium]|nr:putative diguanylate kinase [Magnetococcales bacterium]HIJ83428.1 EAL domain-containing protein [Magnetococcales bacterium]